MSSTRRSALQQEDPSFFDSEVLDEYRLPFGDWLEQGINWATVNMGGVFDWIKWPFQALFDLLLEAKFTGFPWPEWMGLETLDRRVADPYFDLNIGLLELPWWVVVIVMSGIALFARNARVAVFTAAALVVSALMGPEYWLAITQTIGIVLVAVFASAIVAIPLGIACGRIDGLWAVVRPTLDAMQVVHSFVYMLPFIFFFDIGMVSATMVAMVFALPPLVRLTNLGIRQVPEDVVEASRSFGASERRVLFDVQLPLARTAIMTGLNQTLMLAFSMLGIAAIMGAEGLGRLMYRAINNQNSGLAASSGLAFFLVAVAMDRISQRDGDERTFGQRFVAALTNLRTPENLLPDADDVVKVAADEPALEGLSVRERLGLPLVLAGSILALISLPMTWSTGSIVSSHARAVDEVLGGSHSGLDATGGSWFGVTIGGFAVLAMLAAGNTLLRGGGGSRLLGPESTLIGGGAMFGAALGFLTVNSGGVATSMGFAPWLAMLGAVLVLAGGAWASVDAPFAPHRPLPDGLQKGRMLGGLAALVLLVLGCFSYWIVDQRIDTRTPEQLEVFIADQEARIAAADEPTETQLERLAELQDILALGGRINLNSFTEAGPGFGPFILGLGVIALLFVLPGAGLFGVRSENGRRFFNGLAAAAGFAITGLALGWIGSLARTNDKESLGDDGFAELIVSGAGSFFVLCAGLIFFATARPVLNLFFRRKVYKTSAQEVVNLASDEAVEEPMLSTAGV